MTRLFAGTPWDRPPRCERCGALEAECLCPPLPPPCVIVDPKTQIARLRVEKRPGNKRVTVVSGLEDAGAHLEELARKLKAACGSGGTAKDGVVEIQGEHIDRVRKALDALGYRTKGG
jgi:translation initiation factor 1